MSRKLLTTLIGLAWAVTAQTLPPGVQKKASVAGITEYAFPNGLRVVLMPDPSSPKITVNAVYLVGSRHEGYGETGMAHLLEHLNFIRSTSGRDIKKELVDHGASWNGTTSDDRTNYFETVTATDENLKWALGLEAERMVNMRIEKTLLDTEMTVVRNEFERGENSNDRILQERVAATAFLWHNYGKSTIGSLADIEKVPIERLAAFYRKYYQPDNAVIVIAGQFDPARALTYVAQSAGAIPRPARTLDATYTVEPAQDGERTVELRRVGKGKSLVMAWHGPAMAHPDSAALEVLAGILSGPNGTGRLYKAVVDNKKAVSVRFGNEEQHDPGLIMASATLSDDQSIDDVKKTISDTLKGIVSEPPSKDEVAREQTRTLRSMERTLANSQQFAMRLTEMIADGDWRMYFTNYEQIKSVTPEDVVRVAKLYLKDSNLTVGVFVPTTDTERTVVPETPDLPGLMSNLKTSLGVTDVAEFDPSPANIEKHITRSKLPNGLTLSLLPKPNRGGTALAEIQLRFGDEKSLVGMNAVSELTSAMLMRGTKTKTRQQIQEEMDKLDVRIGVGGGRGGGGGLGSASASVQGKAENFVPGLRLAVEILREPAFPEADFEQIRKQRITALERSKVEPDSLAGETLQRNLSPFPKGDVRYIRTIDEQIEDLKKVTLDDLKKFHAKFYGASHGDFVAVGQFDPAALQKAATELLGNWNSQPAYALIASKYLKTVPVNLKIETPDKQNARFSAGLRIRMTDTDPDYAAMVLANYMFGGSISGRLPNRVRNKEGLSYSVGSSFTAPAEGDAALFSAAAIANPKNAPQVEASFKDELAKTVAGGFTAEEVDAAKKAIRDERIIGRSQDQSLVGLIALRNEYGRTMMWDEQMDSKLAALTVQQVNAAFKKIIDPAAVLIVKAGDFKTASVYQ